MALLLSLVANLQQREPYRAGYFPVDWRISWTLNLLQTTLAPAVPFKQTDWPVPFGPFQFNRGFSASYNLNLIGQDKLPIGKQLTDLTPRSYEYRSQAISWAWSYNLNLIGQDRLPTGKQVYDLPPTGPAYSVSLRTWIALPIISPPPQVTVIARAPYFTPPRQPLRFDYDIYRNDALLNSIVTAQLPFNQLDWPTPKGPVQPALSWTYSYNLNLIGQDQLPPGEQRTDRPLWPFETGQYRSWTVSYNLNLIGQDKLPTGKQVTDLVPRPFELAQYRSWTYSYNLNLIGKDVLPTGKALTDLPPRPFEQAQYRSWTASYNKNLIGQDKLPTGVQVTGLPPRDYDRAVQLRTWIQSVNVALTVQAAQVPFNQYDWPVPRGPQPLLQTWTNSFNLNLIGKDKLPFRQMDWPVPRAPEYPINLRSSIFYPQLTPPPTRLPFNQYDWPLPQIAAQPDRTYTFRSQFLTPFVPPPIPTVTGPDRPWVRDWWDRDEWGNFYPGSGIRRG